MIFENLFFTWLQILMNAGMRVHVLQVTDVLIRKVHMSAHHQSQVILFTGQVQALKCWNSFGKVNFN